MTLGHRASLRTIAAGSVLGLAAGTAAVLGTAGTASAVPVGYDCTVPVVGAQTFTTDITSTAPAQLPTGATTTPDVTTLLTVPANLADLMRGLLSIDEIAGQIVSQVMVDGTAVPTTLTIPRTDIGDSGSVVLTATGPLAPITGGTPGDVIELATGDQQVAMSLFDLDGDPAGSVFDIPCTPAPDQDLVVDTISVVKAGSRTTTSATYSARRDKATGVATVKASNVPAEGKVRFVLKRGTRKVGAVTSTVTDGKAKAVFNRVRRSGQYTLVATYLGSDLVKGSSARDGFRVR